MATFTFRNHHGLTPGHAQNVEAIAAEVVAKAAKNSPWNQMSTAPTGFDKVTTPVPGTNPQSFVVKSIHSDTGIEFKAGFHMVQESGQQKWEGQAVHYPYRLDLQNIENGWANWSVQTGNNTVACCLMEVGRSFSQAQLVHALVNSAVNNQLCEMTGRRNPEH